MIRAVFLVAVACAAASPASALDRPAAEAAARACAAHGPGFVEIPGTTTCIRIGGRVRSDYTAGTRRASRDDATGLGASGRLMVDSRTDTAYGPLRAVVRLNAGQGSSAFPR